MNQTFTRKWEPWQTSKSSPWMLISHCFIPEDKDYSDVEAGPEKGNPARDPLRKKTTIPRRVSQMRVAAEEARGGREVTRVFSYQPVNQDGSRDGTYTIIVRGRWAMRVQLPTEFLKDGLKRPWRYQPGMVALHKKCQYQRSTMLLISKWPFACLVCVIAQEQEAYDLCFQVHAIHALQGALTITWHASMRMPTCAPFTLSM